MNCQYHTDREVIGTCVSCGKPVCSECKVIFKGNLYCNPCVDSGRAKKRERGEMLKKTLTYCIMALVIGLLGFNEYYRLFMSINWMHVSFFLLFVIGVFIVIKVFAKK